MKFFMSGELDHSVSRVFIDIANDIGNKLNSVLKDRDYGRDVIKIGIIPVVVTQEFWDEGFKERRLWQRKDQSADYRLRINLEKFLNSDDEMRRLLIIKNIIVSIRDLGRKAKKGFDAQLLENDVLSILGIAKKDIDKIEML